MTISFARCRKNGFQMNFCQKSRNQETILASCLQPLSGTDKLIHWLLLSILSGYSVTKHGVWAHQTQAKYDLPGDQAIAASFLALIHLSIYCYLPFSLAIVWQSMVFGPSHSSRVWFIPGNQGICSIFSGSDTLIHWLLSFILSGLSLTKHFVGLIALKQSMIYTKWPSYLQPLSWH